jgi:hypothetical protein
MKVVAISRTGVCRRANIVVLVLTGKTHVEPASSRFEPGGPAGTPRTARVSIPTHMKPTCFFRPSGSLLVAALLSANTARLTAQKSPDSVVARAKVAISTLHDSTSLAKEGFGAIGFGAGVKDLSPFQGQHWIQLPRFMVNPPVDIAHPNFMMYLPVGDSLIPVGVAYTHRVPAGAALPEDLDGVPAEWHSHVFCRNLPGEGSALADGPDDCKARGGTSAPMQIAMVHTWTVPNPDGPFAHDNPVLPYIATGLKLPTHVTRDDRLVGLALGETYGAKLPIAHRIELEAKRTGKTGSLDAPRAKLKEIASNMKAAEKAGDDKKVASLRRSAIDEYNEIAADYRSMAATPELKSRYDAELDMALDGMGHHHM